MARSCRPAAWLALSSAAVALASSAPIACGPGGGGSGGQSGASGSSGAAGVAGASGAGGNPIDGGEEAGNGDASQDGPGGLGGGGGATGDSGAQDGSTDTGSDAPVSLLCGDAIRDAITEECDDGLGTGEDACTASCRAHNYLVVATQPQDAGPKLGSRTLGLGRHPTAGSASGSVVTFVEKVGSSHSLQIAFFDSLGARQGAPLLLGSGAKPSEQADAVVAALPSGKFAVAWNDIVAGTTDIGVRVVQSGSAAGTIVYANQTKTGAQQDPDVLWTGTELIVAWTDSGKPVTRRFDANLVPLAGEEVLGQASSLARAMTLAPIGGSWAAAWRASSTTGQEEIRVRAGAIAWTVGPFVPGAAEERPALVELDATHLLLVFTVGTDPLTTGTASVTRLRAAILDTAGASSPPVVPLTPSVEPWASDITLLQSRAALARSGSRTYLSWQSESPTGDARDDEVWLREVSWNGTSLTWAAEIPLQADAPRAVAQRAPALAATPLGPAGALVTVWEDSTQSPGHPMLPDLVFGLRPTPIVTLGSAIDGGGA